MGEYSPKTLGMIMRCAITHFPQSVLLKPYGNNSEWFIQLPLDKIHSVEADLVSMITYSELFGLWDPRLSLILGLDSLPPVLFERHPGRRYQNDINFTDAEVISSEKFAAQLNRQIISAAIDGRLSYKTERGIL